MKYYDAFCRVMPPISRASVLPLTSTEMVKYGKMLQSVDVKSSKILLQPYILLQGYVLLVQT